MMNTKKFKEELLEKANSFYFDALSEPPFNCHYSFYEFYEYFDKIFCHDKGVIVIKIPACFCYGNKHSQYIYVKCTGRYITYKDVFKEISKQCNPLLACDHMFVEGFDNDTPIQYSLSCGS